MKNIQHCYHFINLQLLGYLKSNKSSRKDADKLKLMYIPNGDAKYFLLYGKEFAIPKSVK
jgi:hypothetical protein